MQWSCKVSSSSTLEEDFGQRKHVEELEAMLMERENCKFISTFLCFWPVKKISTCVCSKFSMRERERDHHHPGWFITYLNWQCLRSSQKLKICSSKASHMYLNVEGMD